MSGGRYAQAVEIVTARLEADDPQLPGCEVRAERIVSDLFEMGYLAIGRRVERVDVSGAVL